MENEELYSVFVNHTTRNSRYSSGVIDVASNINVTSMELYTAGLVEMGGKLTIFAILDNDAGGYINFTINGTIYSVPVVGGRAVLSVSPVLAPGSYEVEALYLGDDVYCGQLNTTDIVVKVKLNPSATVIAPSVAINGTNITIQASTNFNLDDEALKTFDSLQFVVRNCCCFCYTFFFSNLVVYK